MEDENQYGAKRAAIRKMDQELGISADQLPIDQFQFLTKILYKAPSDGIWGEHEGNMTLDHYAMNSNRYASGLYPDHPKKRFVHS